MENTLKDFGVGPRMRHHLTDIGVPYRVGKVQRQKPVRPPGGIGDGTVTGRADTGVSMPGSVTRAGSSAWTR